jgi:hypothetical protein
MKREGSIPDLKYSSVWLHIESLQKQMISGTVFWQQHSSSTIENCPIIVIDSWNHTRQLKLI